VLKSELCLEKVTSDFLRALQTVLKYRVYLNYRHKCFGNDEKAGLTEEFFGA